MSGRHNFFRRRVSPVPLWGLKPNALPDRISARPLRYQDLSGGACCQRTHGSSSASHQDIRFCQPGHARNGGDLIEGPHGGMIDRPEVCRIVPPNAGVRRIGGVRTDTLIACGAIPNIQGVPHGGDIRMVMRIKHC